jgi:predicted anti-sigma-YlaC factor YlaD
MSSRLYTVGEKSHSANGTTECAGSFRGKRLMTCRELISLLSQYCDGELTAQRRIWADEHLARCEKCALLRGFARATMLIQESVKGLDDPSGELKLPEDFIEGIVAIVRET